MESTEKSSLPLPVAGLPPFLVIGPMLAILGAYWNTFSSMAGIWARSETFAHGFAVPFIAGWLIWRDRGRLAGMAPHPAWAGLLLLGAMGCAWLAGELGEVNSLSQFAVVAMLLSVVPCVAGMAVTRILLFPLAFTLAFTVPMGEFLLPQLMQSTADFTVLALRLSGVPVFREGQHLVIPSGQWSVVEACSGIRYLIASLMVGTLYAWLNYRSFRLRAGFILIAAGVPLVANWVRAYLIVMIGHLSGNRLAVGVDHLLYGWLFFGLVMALMFRVGSRWQEPASTEAAPVPPPRPVPASRPLALWGIALAVLMVAGTPRLAGAFIESLQPEAGRVRLPSLPDVPGWRNVSGGLTAWEPHFEGATDSSHQTYRQGGQAVGVFLAYYRNQSRDRKMVSSSNYLAGVEGSDWVRVAESSEPFSHEGRSLRMGVTALKNRLTDERLTAWQCYWIGGRLTSSDYLAKAYMALSRLVGEGDDSATLVVYVREGRGGGESRILSAFMADFLPALDHALPGSRSQR